jgi:hypothetical protein
MGNRFGPADAGGGLTLYQDDAISRIEYDAFGSKPQSGTTAQRPSSSLVGQGSQYFDTTLGKPIWSAGASWKDATGATV